MTWVDIVFVVLVLAFVALGARLGSLWTGACILGGFFGAALVDTYAMPLSGLMGHFPASTLVAAVLLYLAGVCAFLVPGAILSQIGSAFLLNLIDGAFGLFTGAFTAVMLVSVILLLTVPMFPQFESNKAFRQSKIVRPYHRILEDIFSHIPFKAVFTQKKIKKEAERNLVPLVDEAGDKIKKLVH